MLETTVNEYGLVVACIYIGIESHFFEELFDDLETFLVLAFFCQSNILFNCQPQDDILYCILI